MPAALPPRIAPASLSHTFLTSSINTHPSHIKHQHTHPLMLQDILSPLTAPLISDFASAVPMAPALPAPPPAVLDVDVRETDNEYIIHADLPGARVAGARRGQLGYLAASSTGHKQCTHSSTSGSAWCGWRLGA